MPSEPNAELLAAILAVRQAVPYVQKTGRISAPGAGNYSYASEGDVIGALSEPMRAAGLFLIPHAIDECTMTELHSVNAKGEPRTTHRVDLRVTYRLYHTGGGFLEVPSFGRGDDSGDKSAGKAATYAYKDALRRVFMLETGDDPDKDASPAPEDAGRAKREMPAKPPAKPASAPKPQPQGGNNTAPAVNAQGAPAVEFHAEVTDGETKEGERGYYARWALRFPDGKSKWVSCFHWDTMCEVLGTSDPGQWRGNLLVTLSRTENKRAPDKPFWNVETLRQDIPPLDPGASYPDDCPPIENGGPLTHGD